MVANKSQPDPTYRRRVQISYAALAIFTVVSFIATYYAATYARDYISARSNTVTFDSDSPAERQMDAAMVLQLPQTGYGCGGFWQATVPPSGWQGLVQAIAGNQTLNPDHLPVQAIELGVRSGPNSQRTAIRELRPHDSVMIASACAPPAPAVTVAVDRPPLGYEQAAMAVRLPETGSGCGTIWFAVVPSEGPQGLFAAIAMRNDINPGHLTPETLLRESYVEAAAAGYRTMTDVRPGDLLQFNPSCPPGGIIIG